MKQNSTKARVAQGKPSYSQLASEQRIVVTGGHIAIFYLRALYFFAGV